MKKINLIKGTVLSLVVGIAFLVAVKGINKVKTTKVEPTKIFTVDNKDLALKENIIITGNEKYIEFEDGSWVDIDVSKNHYEFQEVEKGDNSSTVGSMNELKKLVNDYYSKKLNLKVETTI